MDMILLTNIILAIAGTIYLALGIMIPERKLKQRSIMVGIAFLCYLAILL